VGVYVNVSTLDKQLTSVGIAMLITAEKGTSQKMAIQKQGRFFSFLSFFPFSSFTVIERTDA
jgi:bisphosphoglycerate-independent phosphoglycerate mutase (AlkP superfamily)